MTITFTTGVNALQRATLISTHKREHPKGRDAMSVNALQRATLISTN